MPSSTGNQQGRPAKCDALDGGLGHGFWQAGRLWLALGGLVVRRGGSSCCRLSFAGPATRLGARSHKIKPAEKAPPPKIETTRTRFIVNLERHVDFEVSSLTHPNRVLVDLPEVRLVLPDAIGDTPVGLIKSFRHGMSAPGKSRVVIDVTGPVVVEKTDDRKGTGRQIRKAYDRHRVRVRSYGRDRSERSHARGRARPRCHRPAAADAQARRSRRKRARPAPTSR